MEPRRDRKTNVSTMRFSLLLILSLRRHPPCPVAVYFRNTCHLRIGTLSPWLTNTRAYLAIFPNTCTSSSLLFSLLMLRLYGCLKGELAPRHETSSSQIVKRLGNYSWIRFFGGLAIFYSTFKQLWNILEYFRGGENGKPRRAAFSFEIVRIQESVGWKV